MQTLRYPIDSKPPFGLTLLLALQHLLAALGGIIAVPLVIGNVLKLPTPDTIVLAKRNGHKFYFRSSRTGN